MIGTNSPGITLLFWFFGVLWCLAGTHVYLEYGLNVPRYVVDGIEQSIPRNGGDLNYVCFARVCPQARPRGAADPSSCNTSIPSHGTAKTPSC